MITHDGKDYHVIEDFGEIVIGYCEVSTGHIELFRKAFDRVSVHAISPYYLAKIMEHHSQLKFNKLCDAIAENMTEYATEHWQEFVCENCFAGVDAERELERAFRRLKGRDLETEEYDPLLASPIIQKGVEDMNDIICEKMRKVEPPPRTMAEKLREVGMSERDFL